MRTRRITLRTDEFFCTGTVSLALGNEHTCALLNDKRVYCWGNNDQAILTGSYNNFFRMFDRSTKRDVTLEASREIARPKTILKAKKICSGGKRKKDEVSVDSLDFNKKILHTAWHPTENIIAVAATNNLFIFQDKF